ncbi:S8 family serine peptidase, partial [Promineifilum sp.]|uniref:S8 family serine peptidase n=1 Tax=Promineifilum sp. TaxID=2664178 RepID=UPI0035AD82C5
MKRVSLLFIALLGAFLLAGGARASAAWTAKTEPALAAALAGGGEAEFLVVLSERADLSRAAALGDKTARGRFVYETLAATAARSQAPLRALLDARGATYRAYWVANMIWVRGDANLARTLAARPEVSRVYANTPQRAALPEPSLTGPRAATAVEWNVAHVGAPEVWAQGYTGQGAVIGGQDTGYDWTHPALRDSYRGWNGSAADHDYSWHDAIHEDTLPTNDDNECGYGSLAPCDDSSHGTHTMGTMVGQTPQSSIGLAPGAKWIGCRNMENGVGTPATYTECYEWFIAPYPVGGDPFTDGDPARAPDVINNSWACTQGEGCTAPDVLRAVVEAVRAAGILSVHSAGNEGGACASIGNPAAIYDASFTVGATDSQDVIAGFSSRGPVLVDGSNRPKPDIVAPGVGIRSSVPGGGYGWSQGTSMAAPHVAGLAALLISAEPALAGQVDELERIITTTAVRRTTTQGCGG